jgi:hypothetical protein
VGVELGFGAAVEAADRVGAGDRGAGLDRLEREAGACPARMDALVEVVDFLLVGGDEVVVEGLVVELDDGRLDRGIDRDGTCIKRERREERPEQTTKSNHGVSAVDTNRYRPVVMYERGLAPRALRADYKARDRPSS